MTDDRAVSEVIGFIIIVGIVFTSIGIVYFNAIPALEVAENQQHTENSERVFSVLKYNLNEIAQKGVPERATEMRMKGGTLTTIDGVTRINVAIENSSVEYNTSEDELGGTVNTNRMSYKTSTAKIAYENGAVFRTSDDGETAGMISEPGWRIEDEGPIILPQIAVLGASSVGGDGVARIESEELGRLGNVTEPYPSDPYEIEIRINSTYANAWGRYFNRTDGVDSVTRPDEDELTVTIDASDQRILYSKTEVSVDIS